MANEGSGRGRLTGRVAVITGATSGFGAAIARRFAAEGAAIVAHGRNPEAGRALVEELEGTGAEAIFVAGDVGDAGDAGLLAEAAAERFGRVDALILNAGISKPGVGPFWEVPVDEFDLVWRTNVRGVWLCAQTCAPLLAAGSSIVLMGSELSVVGAPDYSAYAASKGAVLQLARGMALDLAPRGVRVNAICPGVCETPMSDAALNGPGAVAKREEVEGAIPLGRLGLAEEVAQAALFFASEDSSYCTGTSLLVDGGVTAA